MAGRINIASIREKLSKSPKVINAATNLARQTTLRAVTQAVDQYAIHPVTDEIEGGITAPNSSRTLGGVANLFSFIGFNSGSDPTSPVYKLFQSTLFRGLSNIIVKNTKTIYRFKVNAPTEDDFAKATPMPWAAGRSFLYAVENGISGLGYYLHLLGKGRSGGGVQLKKQIRNTQFRPIRYFTPIYQRFMRYFKQN